MTERVVVLLRGINVGGHNKVPMTELRVLAEANGLANPKTHIQSGNLVVDGSDPARVASTMAAVISSEFGLDVPVIVRSASQWRAVVTENPFPVEATDGSKVHALFLHHSATEAVSSFAASSREVFAPERVALGSADTDVVYVSTPAGMSAGKVVAALSRIDNASGGTMRNWNTVLAVEKLL